MHSNKVLLSWVVQHLSQTAAKTNGVLRQDYIDTVKKLSITEKDSGFSGLNSLPPPLLVTNMKMKFSANVSRDDTTPHGDLMLEFDSPANFHGEIHLTPFNLRTSHINNYGAEDDGCYDNVDYEYDDEVVS